MKEFTKLIDQLLVQDKEREALQIHLEVLRLEIHSARNQLAEEQEQIKSLKVQKIVSTIVGRHDLINIYFKDEKDAADRLAQEAKVRAKQAKDDVVRSLRIRVNEELPDEIRAQFDPLPKTIPEIDDAIGSANARIHLMGSADEQVLIDVNILFY